MATKTSKQLLKSFEGDVNNYNNYYNFNFYSAKILIALKRFMRTKNINCKNKLSNLQVLNIKYKKGQ